MKATDENIKVLSNAVLRDVRGDADQILADARTKADEIRRRAQEQAEAERAQILEQATVETDQIRGQVVATNQLKARTMQLEQREKLLEEVFNTVKQRLPSVLRGSDYEKIAQRLLREAITQLGGSTVIVRADPETLKSLSTRVLEDISKETGMQIRLGDPLEKGLGVVAETEDKRRQYDNTLETRLRRMQDTLRSSVYRILMGEAL
jgi:vacuolar-type H+-ATPase subunit E/Vma4